MNVYEWLMRRSSGLPMATSIMAPETPRQMAHDHHDLGGPVRILRVRCGQIDHQ